MVDVRKLDVSKLDFFPRCEAELSDWYKRYGAASIKKRKRCLHRAKYIVDGLNMCGDHAGKCLLLKHIRREE